MTPFTPHNRSHQNLNWVADQAEECSHPFGSDRAIDWPVIHRQRYSDDQAGFNRPLAGYDRLSADRSDGKDRGLWGINDCCELFGPVHSKVSDGQRATLQLMLT